MSETILAKHQGWCYSEHHDCCGEQAICDCGAQDINDELERLRSDRHQMKADFDTIAEAAAYHAGEYGFANPNEADEVFAAIDRLDAFFGDPAEGCEKGTA